MDIEKKKMADQKKRSNKKQNEESVVQFNNVIKFNMAIVIFIAILIYVLLSVFKSLGKETISIYKVAESNINNNIKTTGIAIRNENVVKTDKTGYICYFSREAEKIAKGHDVCAVDETGDIINSITLSGDEDYKLTDDDYSDIRNIISLYKTNYSDNEFDAIYKLKNDIDDRIYEITNTILDDKIENESASMQSTLKSIKADESGIVMYYLDGFENVSVDGISENLFDINRYERKPLKTGEVVNSGDAVFKLLTDENWSIVCKVTSDDINLIKDRDYLTFIINNSGDEISITNFEIRTINGEQYLILNLAKYMINYVSERLLQIEIVLDKNEGLKIPNSAIAYKEVYKVGENYMQYDEATSSYYVNLQYMDESGKLATKLKSVGVFRQLEDDGSYLVDPVDLESGDVIVDSTGNALSTSLLPIERLEGVYLANEGIADFNEINVIKQSEEFTIISKQGNIKEFDNIVMNTEGISENQIIY